MYTFLLFFHCFPIFPGKFGRKKFPLTQYHGNLRQGDILYQKIFIFRFPYANMQPSLGLSARPGPSHNKRQAPFLPWIRSVLPPACTTLRPPPSSARRRLHRHRLFLSRTAPVHSPAPPPTGTTAPLPRQIVLCPFPSGTSRQDCTALCNLHDPPPSDTSKTPAWNPAARLRPSHSTMPRCKTPVHSPVPPPDRIIPPLFREIFPRSPFLYAQPN